MRATSTTRCSIERRADGFRLTVSIADVSHYVRPGRALDNEAFERGTSVYFPGRCVPMLPERLSSELASLRPDVDRLTVSVFLDVDAHGQVTHTEFSRSVIRSRRRLTYEQAQAIIDGKEPAEADVAAALAAMADCAGALRKARMARGAIDLDVPEGGRDGGRRRPPDGDYAALAAARAPARRGVHARGERSGRTATRVGARRISLPHPRAARRGRRQHLAARVSALGLRMSGDGAQVSPAAFQKLVERARESLTSVW
jgi:hypothetical protein